jgi:hypothetical protein
VEDVEVRLFDLEKVLCDFQVEDRNWRVVIDMYVAAKVVICDTKYAVYIVAWIDSEEA